MELDADTAPITVTNSVKLAQKVLWWIDIYRIMDGFMIQGGDPNGDGTGGSEENIKGEFSNNGVDNEISTQEGLFHGKSQWSGQRKLAKFFIVQQTVHFWTEIMQDLAMWQKLRGYCW